MFAESLRQYYHGIAQELCDGRNGAAITETGAVPSSDWSDAYAAFLLTHGPQRAIACRRGALIGPSGAESARFDVIATLDSAPRFAFGGAGANSHSYAPLDGALAAVSVEPALDAEALVDALSGFASIPAMRAPATTAAAADEGYGDWPLKVIFAADGMAAEAALDGLIGFYQTHPEIAPARRPNIVHVAGRYALFRATAKMSGWNRNVGVPVEADDSAYYYCQSESDLLAVAWTLMELHDRAAAAEMIRYRHHELLNILLRPIE